LQSTDIQGRLRPLEEIRQLDRPQFVFTRGAWIAQLRRATQPRNGHAHAVCLLYEPLDRFAFERRKRCGEDEVPRLLPAGVEFRDDRLEFIRCPQHRDAAEHRAGLCGRAVEKAYRPICRGAVALQRAQVEIGLLARTYQQHRHKLCAVSSGATRDRREQLELVLPEAEANCRQQRRQRHHLDRDYRMWDDGEAGVHEHASRQDEGSDKDRLHQNGIVEYRGVSPLALVDAGGRKGDRADADEHHREHAEGLARCRVGKGLRAKTQHCGKRQCKRAQGEVDDKERTVAEHRPYDRSEP
jgi:hypothetical protein